MSSTPPVGTNLLVLNNLAWSTGRRRPEFQIFDCEYALDGLRPIVERKIKEALVNWHEEALAAESAKAADGSFRAHVYVGPEGI